VSRFAKAVAFKVAVSVTGAVISGAILALLGQSPVKLLVAGVTGLPGFLAPAGDWAEAHRAVFVIGTAATGGVLAFAVAKMLGQWEGLGAIFMVGGVLGFIAGGSVIDWMKGSVVNGPVVLVGVCGFAVVWLIASARSAARWKRLEANEARRRRPMLAAPHGHVLPLRRTEPHGYPVCDPLAARSASNSASFLSHTRSGPRGPTPPTD
jgi:hypothetical protein